MTVRSHLPWPLRWAMLALMLGFSAAMALWAFEFGKDIAGLDRDAQHELEQVREEIVQLRSERDKAQGIADTADSLLKAERAAQERLAQQLKLAEAENFSLKSDLGFFERLLPASSGSGINVRGLQAQMRTPGQLRYQLLVTQIGKAVSEFGGRYELQLSGTLDGQPWSFTPAGGAKVLRVRQYARVEGTVEVPMQAVVKAVQVKVTDADGSLRATQSIKL